ncbi:unnamed protein product [Notodromas monacha]|uniref:RILP-like protein n=1 Tax=Notodromas monacha TaxID=399045 RepID=A0A7R9BDF5_9CRUS|nr:unnamed protein product [Notodromas monacha]CAG0913344.1 unnamed protein product [Notodromas monacha]
MVISNQGNGEYWVGAGLHVRRVNAWEMVQFRGLPQAPIPGFDKQLGLISPSSGVLTIVDHVVDHSYARPSVVCPSVVESSASILENVERCCRKLPAGGLNWACVVPFRENPAGGFPRAPVSRGSPTNCTCFSLGATVVRRRVHETRESLGLMPQLDEGEYHPTNRMDSEPESLTVVEVYDMATDVGKEFERIIDQHGPAVVQGVMPKVIAILERMESVAMRNEAEFQRIQDYESRIHQLESDRNEKAECRVKYERDLETMEESWTKETRDLGLLVSQLKQENARLAGIIANQPSSAVPMSPELDHGIVERLQNKVDSLRDQVRRQDFRIYELERQLDSSQTSLETMNGSCRDLKRRLKSVKEQIVLMVGERADLQTELVELTRENSALKQEKALSSTPQASFIEAQKLVYDVDDPDRPRFTTQELKEILHERNELKERVNYLEDKMKRQTSSPAEIFKKFFGDHWVSPQGSPLRRPFGCASKSPSSPSGFSFMASQK